jgi:hypothetical protein
MCSSFICIVLHTEVYLGWQARGINVPPYIYDIYASINEFGAALGSSVCAPKVEPHI